jgi:hypothetical protein
VPHLLILMLSTLPVLTSRRMRINVRPELPWLLMSLVQLACAGVGGPTSRLQRSRKSSDILNVIQLEDESVRKNYEIVIKIAGEPLRAHWTRAQEITVLPTELYTRNSKEGTTLRDHERRRKPHGVQWRID